MHRKAKKGFAAFSVTDIYAFVVWIVIVLVFFLIFKISGGDNIKLDIHGKIEQTRDGVLLVNLLRQDVGDGIIFSDYIREWYKDRMKKEQKISDKDFNAKITELFSSISYEEENQQIYYRMDIYYNDTSADISEIKLFTIFQVGFNDKTKYSFNSKGSWEIIYERFKNAGEIAIIPIDNDIIIVQLRSERYNPTGDILGSKE